MDYRLRGLSVGIASDSIVEGWLVIQHHIIRMNLWRAVRLLPIDFSEVLFHELMAELYSSPCTSTMAWIDGESVEL